MFVFGENIIPLQRKTFVCFKRVLTVPYQIKKVLSNYCKTWINNQNRIKRISTIKWQGQIKIRKKRKKKKTIKHGYKINQKHKLFLLSLTSVVTFFKLNIISHPWNVFKLIFFRACCSIYLIISHLILSVLTIMNKKIITPFYRAWTSAYLLLTRKRVYQIIRFSILIFEKKIMFPWQLLLCIQNDIVQYFEHHYLNFCFIFTFYFWCGVFIQLNKVQCRKNWKLLGTKTKSVIVHLLTFSWSQIITVFVYISLIMFQFLNWLNVLKHLKTRKRNSWHMARY